LSLNWVAGAGDTVGTTRNFSAYVQPTLHWLRAGLQILPVASIDQGRNVLGNGTLTTDLLAQQYGGRVAWTMPRAFRFTTLTFDGEYDDAKDPIGAYHDSSTTLYLLATFSWDFKRPRQ
jgi:hypothetical protein